MKTSESEVGVGALLVLKLSGYRQIKKPEGYDILRPDSFHPGGVFDQCIDLQARVVGLSGVFETGSGPAHPGVWPD